MTFTTRFHMRGLSAVHHCTCRVTYIELMFNHFLTDDLEGKLDAAVSKLFAILLTPALPCYGYGVSLLRVRLFCSSPHSAL